MRKLLNPCAVRCVIGAGVAMAMLGASRALAQSVPAAAEALKPPTPGRPDDPPVVLNILMGVLVTALVLGAVFIPAKRGHQD